MHLIYFVTLHHSRSVSLSKPDVRNAECTLHDMWVENITITTISDKNHPRTGARLSPLHHLLASRRLEIDLFRPLLALEKSNWFIPEIIRDYPRK